MGFRRRYPLDPNRIINTPIQGTAFLVLLDACIKVNDELKRNKFKSRIILETHDDMTFNAYKPELYDLVELVDGITLNPSFDFLKGVNLKTEWTFGYRLSDMIEA